tara:strand:+ start:634 stop:1290 length:657 start_codon:yes stop_codon:yes gene_type:complete
MAFKLLVEKADPLEFEYIVEEKNNKSESRLYIKGPYMMASDVNKNKRVYDLDGMVEEVTRYDKEMIKTDRAMGELNHPTTAEVDLERACHIVTEMQQDGNIFYGKSKVLQTPCGTIVKQLVTDGVRVGMSSRALGKIDQEGEIGKVTEMKLVAIDCVADPSYSDAFVNGILESKQWILNNRGELEEHFDKFEESLKSLPRKDVNEYFKNKFIQFIRNI